MMKIKSISLLLLPLLLGQLLFAQPCNTPQFPGFDRYPNFFSSYVPARHVEVMLPPGYCAEKRYPVLYVHDGQNVFNPFTASPTSNFTDWDIDGKLLQLWEEGKATEAIVVAIWCTDNRRCEYMPQKPKRAVEKSIKNSDSFFNRGEGILISDNYLKFIVKELKPFIDSTYFTLSDQQNTFILGSSMGGLISCYALCEYPEIFGGAACLSTHWPALDGVFLRYLKHHIPSSTSHKIYFDYGTESLDAEYEPFQQIADVLFMKAGYMEGENFESIKFEGASHNEAAWRLRVGIPLQFLLPPDHTTENSTNTLLQNEQPKH